MTTLKERLLNMRWSDIYLELLPVFEEKTTRMNPSEIRKNYQENPLVGAIDARKLHEIDNILIQELPENVQLLDISPVVPIGLSSVLTRVSQKTILSTIRNLELLADPTVVLALESVKKQIGNLGRDIHFATSSRMVRLQKFAPGSNMLQHFRGFAISSAGKSDRHSQFVFSSIVAQISFWLRSLQKLSSLKHYDVRNISVYISDIRIMEGLIEDNLVPRENIVKWIRTKEKSPFTEFAIDLPIFMDIGGFDNLKRSATALSLKGLRHLKAFDPKLKNLSLLFPEISFRYHPERSSGLGYHAGLCFKISAENRHGKRFSLVDGGIQDWTQKIAQNKKLIFCSSGFGTELFCTLFGK